jgi:hypothetical protein
MAKPDPHDIDPIVHLSALGEKPEASKVREEYETLKPALFDLYVSDRGTFAIAADLVKEKLGIGRRDLEAGLKPLMGDEDKRDSKPLPLARFPELADLVEEEGEVKFLIRNDNGKEALRTETEWEINGQIYYPPARTLIPWLLPRVDCVRAATRRTIRADSTLILSRTIKACPNSRARLITHCWRLLIFTPIPSTFPK